MMTSHSTDPYRAIADMAAAMKIKQIEEAAHREAKAALDSSDLDPAEARDEAERILDVAAQQVTRIQKGRTP
jgi:hypothetical protein